MKKCRLCGEVKPLDDFHKSSHAPDGRQYRCKPCAIADSRRRAAEKPEAKRAADRKYSASSRSKEQRKARRDGPERERILQQKRESWARHSERYAAEQRAKRAANPEPFREYGRLQYRKHKEKRLAEGRAYRRENLDKLRKQWRLKRYGLSDEEFQRMLKACGGLCEICGTDLHAVAEQIKGRDRPALSVDHDHATGAVRGLLCPRCNKAIGLLGEDPARMRAAAAYIEKHQRPAD